MLTEPIQVTLLVADALESFGIRYFIGGSMATAVHGVARATMDVDLVVDLSEDDIPGLLSVLGDDFFVDEQMIAGALQSGISFNMIHKETMFKVDVFPLKNRPFDLSQLERRVAYELASEPTRKAYIASPEDNILSKLEWYRLGGEISDRQWIDVLNVLRIQGADIDIAYLKKWAKKLNLLDLLVRALDDVN